MISYDSIYEATPESREDLRDLANRLRKALKIPSDNTHNPGTPVPSSPAPAFPPCTYPRSSAGPPPVLHGISCTDNPAGFYCSHIVSLRYSAAGSAG